MVSCVSESLFSHEPDGHKSLAIELRHPSTIGDHYVKQNGSSKIVQDQSVLGFIDGASLICWIGNEISRDGFKDFSLPTRSARGKVSARSPFIGNPVILLVDSGTFFVQLEALPLKVQRALVKRGAFI